MNDSYTFRPVTPADAEIVAHHRVAMFRDMGALASDTESQFLQSSISWLQNLFAHQEYVGWFATHEGKIVAGAGIHLRELMPLPESPYLGRWGHIVNVYTEPEHRRHGLARQLMKLALEWTAAQKLDRVTLVASQFGRPLYESLGFGSTNDMKLNS
jgi:GNAT superfamily N-acetyltransferase